MGLKQPFGSYLYAKPRTDFLSVAEEGITLPLHNCEPLTMALIARGRRRYVNERLVNT
jgi:hypothetical protein